MDPTIRSAAGDEPTLIKTEPASPRRAAPPENVGRYKLGVLLGSGGMADVYRAVDPTLNRAVALKFLRAIDDDQMERFLREARAQAQVEHPNICKVYEAGDADGHPYIAMQCIEGMTLAQAMPRMSLDAKIAAIADVAEALHVAHRSGLVHRDLKPSNIMLEERPDGRVHPYVMDFGLARDQKSADLTTVGIVMGTPSYMAPEQARGDRQRVDRRTDIWALGVTLYELLTGSMPFEGESGVALLLNIVQQETPPPRTVNPAIPADLETVILKCLEKDPQRRYDSARALAEDLRRYLDGEPVAARRSSYFYKWVTRARRHPTIAAILGVAALAVLGSMTIALVLAWRSAAMAGAAQRFGQEVERIEAMARYSRMLPLHDIDRERKMIRGRLASIDVQSRALGRSAIGPGEYAIGRGHLALEEYEASRRHLDAAWRSGYRAPQVAYALGRALGELYEHELNDADRIANKEARERRRRKLERDYRDPALEWLRRSSGHGGGDSPSYAEALIAFYEKRYDVALNRARAAFAEVPWLYEAKKLEGDVLLAKGVSDSNAGHYDEAVRRFASAGDAYSLAASMAPSDSSVLLGDAERWARTMKVEIDRGGDPREPYQRGIAAAERASLADPAGEESYRTRAMFELRFGEWQVQHGEQPDAAFGRGIDFASHAIALQHDNPKACSILGLAYFDKARWAVTHGLDPFGFYEQSIRNHRRAVELSPRDPVLLLNLANALRRNAEALHNRGTDAGTMLDESIVFYDRSIAADPESASGHNDRSLAFMTRAEWETASGKDPMKSLAEAVASGERAAKLNPRLPATFINLSVAYYDRGDYMSRHGGDPSDESKSAAANALHAAALNPKLASAHVNAASAYDLDAEYAVAHGRDPHATVLQMVDEGNRALAIDPGHVSAFEVVAQAWYYDAKYAKDHHREAVLAVRSAREAVGKALSLDANNAEVLVLASRIEAVAGALPAAKAMVDRALAVNAANADAWSALMEIELLRGDKEAARVALSKAVALDPTRQR